MVDNKKYFLDFGGLQTLWNKMKNTFAGKTATEAAITDINKNLETILNMVLAVSPKVVDNYSAALSAAPEVVPGIAIKVKNEETINDVVKPAGIYLIENTDPVTLIYVGNTNNNISNEELANIIAKIATLEANAIKKVSITDGTNELGTFNIENNTLLIVHDDKVEANSTSINSLTHRAISAKFGELQSLLTTIPKFEIKIVDELPTENLSFSTIYLVKNADSSSNNLYTEYIYIHNNDGNIWEKLGEQTISLSNYVTKTEVESLVNTEMKNYASNTDLQQTKNEILVTVSETYAKKTDVLTEQDIIDGIITGNIGEEIKIPNEQIEKLI